MRSDGTLHTKEVSESLSTAPYVLSQGVPRVAHVRLITRRSDLSFKDPGSYDSKGVSPIWEVTGLNLFRVTGYLH